MLLATALEKDRCISCLTALAEVFEEEGGYLGKFFGAERVEDQDLIYSIEELGAEVGTEFQEESLLNLLLVMARLALLSRCGERWALAAFESIIVVSMRNWLAASSSRSTALSGKERSAT